MHVNTPVRRQPVPPKIERAIVDFLRHRFARYGFRRARIVPDEDHDGDPALFIEIAYSLSDEPVDSRKTLKALIDLRQWAAEAG
jgi:hypothetical protein